MSSLKDTPAELAASNKAIARIKRKFSEDRCDELRQLMQIMANPVRFHILCALRQQSFSVMDLVDIADASPSNVSQQLKMMRLAGYLASEKRGKQVFYRLADPRIERVVEFLEGMFDQANGTYSPGP